MAVDLTRRLDTGGPYGHTPGAAPPFHAAQNDPGVQADDAQLSRLDGRDVDPLDQADGPVGIRSWDGSDLGYAGKDVGDPQTWGARPYNEVPGMFARLAQDAQTGQ